MSYEFSDPQRENDPTALPDVEVFWISSYGRITFEDDATGYRNDFEPGLSGYYWISGFPGCLPDSDPIGPFSTYDEALQDARSVNV